jgi:uncharacterized FAD-dependent dehydrogenase
MPVRYEDQLPKLQANLNTQNSVYIRDQELLTALETLRAARILTDTDENKQFYVKAFNQILDGNEASQGTNDTAITGISDVDDTTGI